MLKAQQCPNFTHTYARTHTEYTVMLRAVKILISVWTAARFSRQCLLCWPLSPSFVPSISSSSFVPSLFRLPHLHLFCPLRLYLLLFCSSTCPHRVHLSDPVTLAAVRQIASTPTGLNITLLSALLDQIALTVYQQTPWDSGLHSHERTHIHKQHTNTADNHIITAFSILVPSPCLLSGIPVSYFCDQMEQMIFGSLFTNEVMHTCVSNEPSWPCPVIC